MTYKQAAEALLVWREHINECYTCKHGNGYTCSRCYYGEDLDAAANKASKFLKGKKREVSQKARRH